MTLKKDLTHKTDKVINEVGVLIIALSFAFIIFGEFMTESIPFYIYVAPFAISTTSSLGWSEFSAFIARRSTVIKIVNYNKYKNFKSKNVADMIISIDSRHTSKEKVFKILNELPKAIAVTYNEDELKFYCDFLFNLSENSVINNDEVLMLHDDNYGRSYTIHDNKDLIEFKGLLLGYVDVIYDELNECNSKLMNTRMHYTLISKFMSKMRDKTKEKKNKELDKKKEEVREKKVTLNDYKKLLAEVSNSESVDEKKLLQIKKLESKILESK